MRNKHDQQFRDILIRHGKILFPVVVLVVAAVTMAVALGAGNSGDEELEAMISSLDADESEASETEEESVEGYVVTEEPLTLSEDEALLTLMTAYYTALADGDVETIQSLSNYTEETELLRIQELSKYIESYSSIEVYVKPGPVDSSCIAYVYTHVMFYGYAYEVAGLQTFYVCTDEAGDYYLNEGESSEDVLDYILAVSSQDDVTELSLRVNTEYTELITEQTDLASFLSELEQQVSIATGEALALAIAESESEEDSETGSGSDILEDTYAVATTTVNVRVSDSEQADKLGKIALGTRIQVTQVLANGWTQVVYEGQTGYIKSEYLEMENTEDDTGEDTGETAGDAGTEDEADSASSDSSTDVLRTAVAKQNLVLRAKASTSSDKLGTVAGGDTVEVLSESGEWSQIRYNGQTGYVMTEYLQ